MIQDDVRNDFSLYERQRVYEVYTHTHTHTQIVMMYVPGIFGTVVE